MNKFSPVSTQTQNETQATANKRMTVGARRYQSERKPWREMQYRCGDSGSGVERGFRGLSANEKTASTIAAVSPMGTDICTEPSRLG